MPWLSSFPGGAANARLRYEVFATMWDVYLTLGDLPEEPSRKDTADRRPATKAAARDRLARSICADREVFTEADAAAMAAALADAQVKKIAAIITQLVARLQQPPHTIVVSGRGRLHGSPRARKGQD